MRSRWIKLAALALCVCVPAACSLNDTPALRVGGNVWLGYEPMHLAKHFGYYDPINIKVIDFPSAAEVMSAYRNGAIDVAALTADEALSVIAVDPGRHSIILVADYSNGADAIVARPEFADLRALRGRRIGVEANALGALMLTRALDVAGMSRQDIQLVPLPLDSHEVAFNDGQVDAVVTFEPQRTRLLAQGARELFNSAQIPGEVIDVVVMRKALAARRHQVRMFVEGWFRGLRHMQSDRAAAIPLIARRQGVSDAQVTRMLDGVELVGLDRNRQLLGSDQLAKQLARLALLMTERNLLAAPPDLSSLADPQWVNEIKQ